MKYIIAFIFLLLSSFSIYAQSQVQRGCVKTRGRMVDGQHVPGVGLPGAVVSIKDRNDIAIKSKDGSFSFPTNGTQYVVQSVTKKDYTLVDADAAPKTYQHSSNTHYFVMETPEQLLQDKLEKERTIRRTLNMQLQKREEEIEVLKAENKISQQRYQQLLQDLYAAQENNEKLISEMAERYARLDYDQLDEFYRHVTNYIEVGELVKADSLLKTRGDLNSQIVEHLQQGALIQQKKEELNQAEFVHQFDKEELARRCYSYFENFKMQHQYDSAAYYIEKRASLDTTNVQWQVEVGEYYYAQRQFHKEEFYYIRALKLYRQKAVLSPNEYELAIAHTLHNLAVIYYYTQRFNESETKYRETLYIYRMLANGDPLSYERHVALLLHNLATLNAYTNRYSEAESLFKESLYIYKKYYRQRSTQIKEEIALCLKSYATMYCAIGKYVESESMFNEALNIYTKLSEDNPQFYEPLEASALLQKAILYRETNRFAESEILFTKVIGIYRKFLDHNSQAYECDLAEAIFELAILYQDLQRFSECEISCKESLKIRRKLIKYNFFTEDSKMAETLELLARLYFNTQRILESEELYKESLKIRKRLADKNPQTYEIYLAPIIFKLAIIYYNTQRISESEETYKECLEIYGRLAKGSHRHLNQI